MEKEDTDSKVVNVKATTTTEKVSITPREYTAGGTVCAEFAINRVVARVHLDRLNHEDYVTNKLKYFQSTANNKKGIKRKLHESQFEDTGDTSSSESSIAKKGRNKSKSVELDKPPKVNTTSGGDVAPVRKRGRPRKILNKVIEIDDTDSTVNSNSDLDRPKINIIRRNRFKRFNGDKNLSVVTTARVRKPNPKFQDFVVSPNVRYYAQSNPESPVRERAVTPKPKPKPKLSKPEEEILDLTRDPLDISVTDEEVHSFLPVFEKSSQSDGVILKSNNDDKAEKSSISNKAIKEKENQINNTQSKLTKKNTAKSESEISGTSNSPSKPRNDKSSTLLKSPKPKVYTNMHKLNQQKLRSMFNINSPISQKKTKLDEVECDVEASIKQHNVSKVTPNAYKVKTKVNGSNNAIKPKKNVRYVLIDSDNFPNRTKASKSGDVDFNKLVRSLKSVKLPAANWKIRIVVSRQQTISEVTFTNKEVNERCVKFSRTFTGYIITFGKSTVKLIGAPPKISSFNDVTVLLDIIHNVALKDPVLEYCTDKDV